MELFSLYGCGRNCGGIQLPAKLFEFFQIMLDLAFGVESVLIVCTKISKRNIVLEHMVNRYEHRVGNSDRGTVCTPPNNKSLILCGKEGI